VLRGRQVYLDFSTSYSAVALRQLDFVCASPY
jgi:hypothetical protein